MIDIGDQGQFRRLPPAESALFRLLANPTGRRSVRTPRRASGRGQPQQCAGRGASTIANDAEPRGARGSARRLAADAHACALVAMRTIGRAHHRGAVVAVWAVGRRDRATRSDAPSVIATGGAGGGVGLRDLDGEQAEGQQARSNCFHRYLPQRVSSRACRAGATPACQVKRTRSPPGKPEFPIFRPLQLWPSPPCSRR